MKTILRSFKIFICKISNRPTFIIEIKYSAIEHIYGDKNLKFIDDCRDIIRKNAVESGLIFAVKNSSGKTVIKTSSDVSSTVAQKLRNVWSFYSK